MDPAIITAGAQQGALGLIAVALLWFTMRELKEFLRRYDEKLDKQSASIARLLRALGEDD